MAEGLEHIPLGAPISEPHRAVTGGGGPSSYPEREPGLHAEHLLTELTSLEASLREIGQEWRPADADGFLFTGEFEEGYDANYSGLADSRAGSELVDVVGGRAIVRTEGNLGFLRGKIEKYADPSTTSEKTGLTRNAPLVSSLQVLRPTSLSDLSDGWLRTDDLEEGEQRWVELWASGGRYGDESRRASVRRAIGEFLAAYRQGEVTELPSFATTEHDIYFVELSGVELMSVPAQLPGIDRIGPPARPIVPELLSSQYTDPNPNVVSPPSDSTRVAILDTGVSQPHPLLEPVMEGPGISAIPGTPFAADADGHGTLMAGFAAYRDLADQLSSGTVEARCNIENARIVEGGPYRPDPDFMLDRTEEAVLELESIAQRRRVFSMSLGARTAAPGAGTSWGVALDQLAYSDGDGRVLCVAAGNLRHGKPEHGTDYPSLNLIEGITSPGEAINALTVGAITEKDTADRAGQGHEPLAGVGELCPVSLADVAGNRAIKPEIVLEGGNVATDGSRCLLDEGLQLLSTSKDHATGDYLGLSIGTSVATASAAGILAEIWNANPSRRPETVRGLIVHSARWTPAIVNQMQNLTDRRRSFGYGVPDANSASWSSSARPTMILESSIRPAKVEGTGREMHFVDLPMPDSVLQEMGDAPIEISVTLSYFAEPNETRVVRYASSGLRWALQRPLETPQDFRKRVNKLERDGDPNYQTVADDLPWEIGPDARGRGTVQSDRAKVVASQLTGGRAIAIWPVLGWWDDRGVKQDAAINYSLLVSLDAGDQALDLYTEVLNNVTVQTQV